MNPRGTEYCKAAEHLSTVIVRKVTCSQTPGSMNDQQVSHMRLSRAFPVAHGPREIRVRIGNRVLLRF